MAALVQVITTLSWSDLLHSVMQFSQFWCAPVTISRSIVVDKVKTSVPSAKERWETLTLKNSIVYSAFSVVLSSLALTWPLFGRTLQIYITMISCMWWSMVYIICVQWVQSNKVNICQDYPILVWGIWKLLSRFDTLPILRVQFELIIWSWTVWNFNFLQ